MTATLRTQQILDASGVAGVTINSITGRTNIAYGSWVLEQDGMIITPVGRTKTNYFYTGADQSFVVPAGVTYIFVKLWGAGGSNARAGGWAYGSEGGGGGHARGLIPVTPGETITVRVGQGGIVASTTATIFGGGGMVVVVLVGRW